MSDGELTASGVVIRRFDATDEHRFTFDESGEFPAKLKAFAFEWIVSESDEGQKECSVYDRTKILDAGLRPSDCIEEHRPHWGIATASVEDLTTFRRMNREEANPFEVKAAPFPNGVIGAHPRDIAHANIVHPNPLSGKDGWYRNLALKFQVTT